jgi:hypothetical protein
MKKYILILFAFISLWATAQQGSFPVPAGFGGGEAAVLRQRVIDSSGNYMNNVSPAIIDQHKSDGIYGKIVYRVAPEAHNTSVLYAQIPADGSGDLTEARNSTSIDIGERGYYEETAINVPSFNYIEGAPRIETHKQVQNLITYSNGDEFGFSNAYWTKSGSSVIGDASTAGSALSSSTIESASEPYTTFDGASTTGFHAVSNGSGNMRATTVDEISYVDGAMYMVVFDLSLASGTLPYYRPAVSATGATLLGGEIKTSVEGTNTYYFVAEQTTTGTFRWSNTSTAAEYTVSNFYIKQVEGFNAPAIDGSGDVYKTAVKLVEDGTTGLHYIVNSVGGSITSGTTYTASVVAKAAENQYLQLTLESSGFGSVQYANYDLSGGTVTQSAACLTDITALADGWYRCSIIVDATASGGLGKILPFLINSGTATRAASYSGTAGNGVYIWQADLTETDYSAPPIYTTGGTASRVADAITGGGDATLFSGVNSSGVLYGEIAANSDDGTDRFISISDGTNNNAVRLGFSGSNVYADIKVANVTQAVIFTAETVTDYNKVAFSWSENDFALWINGVEVGTDLSGSIFPASTIDEFKFSRGDGAGTVFYGKVGPSGVMVLEYLTDDEMIAITTP